MSIGLDLCAKERPRPCHRGFRHGTLKIHQNDASALVGVGLVKSRKGKPTDGSPTSQHGVKLEPDIIDQIKKLGVE